MVAFVGYGLLAERVRGKIEAQTRVKIVVQAAGFLNEIDPARDATFAGGEEARGVFRDVIALVGVEDRLVEGHPAERRACFNDLVEVAMFSFANRDRFLGPKIVAHNLGEQLPAAADLRGEALADDVAECVSKAD